MSFGWSVGDLVGAVQLLNKAVTALKDAGGASDEYAEEVNFLRSLAVTLEHLNTLQSSPLDHNVIVNLQRHCEQVRQPVLLFLRDIERRFQISLSQRTSWAKVAATPRKLQWALSVSKHVKELRQKISGNMDAIQLCLSQQNL